MPSSPDQLRLAVIPRNQIPELKIKGLSNRKIAKLTGVSHQTVGRALNGPDGPESGPAGPAPVIPPAGEFETIVIDPPWPMTKIERDARPNQAGFSYPTMDEQELREFATIVKPMAATDCHLFMWTTARFFPLSLDLVDVFGFKYVLPMVWHKPGGYQPTGLPQFNCEFIIYGRKGTPKFIDTKGFPCCFNAPRREHSRKPLEFYDIISLVPRKSFDLALKLTGTNGTKRDNVPARPGV